MPWIRLPGEIGENEITAELENGVLTVNVPKAPRPQPKRIQVAPGSQKPLN